jgi:hypothetical protein
MGRKAKLYAFLSKRISYFEAYSFEVKGSGVVRTRAASYRNLLGKFKGLSTSLIQMVDRFFYALKIFFNNEVRP